MNLNFCIFSQRGEGNLVAVYNEPSEENCENQNEDFQSGEYRISNIIFFKRDGDKLKTVASVIPHVALCAANHPKELEFLNPGSLRFTLSQPKFILRHKNFAANPDEVAFLRIQPGKTHDLCLDADAMQLEGPVYSMLGEEVDLQAPFRQIQRCVFANWTCKVMGISFDVNTYKTGVFTWVEKKNQYDRAVKRLKDVTTEDEYQKALKSLEDAHKELVELNKFWSAYTVEDYIKELNAKETE